MSKSRPRPWTTEKNQQHASDSVPGEVIKRKQVKKDVPKSLFEKRVASVSRWLHIYLSMISFAILLFFAVTGLTLNHTDWFADQAKTTKTKGTIQVKWVNNPDTSKVAKLDVVEFFRNKHEVKGYLSEFAIDDSECSITFRGPGYSSEVFIDRKSGKYEFSETRMGLVAVMNDLHKGRDSGRKWGWVIDISAGFIALISLSGLILILFLKRKRSSGLIVAGIGLLLCYAIYKLFVP
ncbi:MAG TPA: peptidase [Sphingobacteriaceae bacterium]|nr:peptidase [Sphingobacteriaceae bacterium]